MIEIISEAIPDCIACFPLTTQANSTGCSSLSGQMYRGIPCLLAIVSLAACTIPVSPKCDDGWFGLGSSCYRKISESSYVVAVTRCQRMGGTLFVANSMEEYNTVNEKLREMNVSSEYYIGLAMMWGDCDPTWQMIDGVKVDEIPSLSLNETIEKAGRSVPVALMNPSNSSIQFVDKDDFHEAICEKNVSYVEYSAKDFPFYFWNSSFSRHTEKTIYRASKIPLKLLEWHVLGVLTLLRPDYSLIERMMKATMPELYKLAELELSSSEKEANLVDWLYNLSLFLRYRLMDRRADGWEKSCKKVAPGGYGRTEQIMAIYSAHQIQITNALAYEEVQLF